MSVQVKLARPLYGPSHPKGPTRGPDVIAVKRATARAFPDIFPWADFDQVYNKRIWGAWKQIEHAHAIHPESGNYGLGAHDLLTKRRRQSHPSEWAWDATSINLMEGEWGDIHPPPKPPIDVVREVMADYLNRAIVNAARWHYYFNRPMKNLGVNPDGTVYADCSAGATGAFFWARTVTGILVPDPNGRGYDNWGNTTSLWDHNQGARLSSAAIFEVGDLALFTEHSGHVIVCMARGDWGSSTWWSNGSEAAPYPVRVSYRTDLRGIVRPELVPAK